MKKKSEKLSKTCVDGFFSNFKQFVTLGRCWPAANENQFDSAQCFWKNVAFIGGKVVVVLYLSIQQSQKSISTKAHVLPAVFLILQRFCFIE